MELVREAAALGCRVEEKVPLSQLTSFHVGGPADHVITAPAAAVPSLLQKLNAADIPVLILGNGSNVLASDAGFRGVVLKIAAGEEDIRREGDRLCAGAGVSLKQLCLFARDRGLSGLETLYGIPGTVGGAVYMNAGAYGGEIADTLQTVTVTDGHGQILTLSAAEAALNYRRSRFMQTGEVILSAVFSLSPGDPGQIRERMADCMSRRREKQPLEYPRAGSFFKRPEGHFAGELIDRCGLRGFAVGDAQISEKHAGFLINRGHATCRDILALSDAVCRIVREKTGVQLEREVRTVGEST